MIDGLIVISVLLTALVIMLCALIYKQQEIILKQISQQQNTLNCVVSSLKELEQNHLNTTARIGHLAADVLQRDVYQSADDRHQLAIKSAKQGKSKYELTQRHGLSLDEAALILSLHSPEKSIDKTPLVKNANLLKPSNLDLV